MEQHTRNTEARTHARRFDRRSTAKHGEARRSTAIMIALSIICIVILSAQTGNSATAAPSLLASSPNATPVPANSRYSPLTIKPFGQQGVLNELSLQVWGLYSWRQGGDAYSPLYDPAQGATFPNEYHNDQPYGYLYRIHVPASFPDDRLAIHIFDADTYNRQDDVPTPTRTATPGSCSPIPCTPSPIPPTPNAYDSAYFWCAQSVAGGCTGNNTDFVVPALRLDAYRTPTSWTQPPWTFGRAAVWRVDEYRQLNTAGDISPLPDTYNANWPTETNFTLWHFDPDATNIFTNPSALSDQPNGGPVRSSYTARYEQDINANYTDLAWIEPWTPITLNSAACGGDCFRREADGSIYFYLYVQSSAGSSENAYDLRVGPVDENYAQGYNCRTISQRWSPLYNNVCYSNEQFYRQNKGLPLNDWASGGALVEAMKALPLNLSTGSTFPMLLSQLTHDNAGEALSVRHFDQDCSNCTSPASTYQMQYCVEVNTTNLCSTGNCEPCSSLLNPACFGDVGDAYKGPNNEWYCAACPNPELATVPQVGTAAYAQFFGPNGECATSWLRLKENLSYSNDTTVWEVMRPALTTTPTPTFTRTSTTIPTFTNTPTNTPNVMATQSVAGQQTATAFVATAIAGFTQTAVAGATLTAQAPTSTPTNTATNTMTSTPTNTPTNTITQTPTNTPTGTRTPTNTPTITPTNSPTNTPTNTPLNTSTHTATNTPTGTRTPTNTPTNSSTFTPTNTTTNIPSETATNMPTATNTITVEPTPSPAVCEARFADVPPNSTFYSYVICLACRGIVNGYACGGAGEPCNATGDPYFRPSAPVTRGQLAKIVSQSAGFEDAVPPTQQTFDDVPPASTFWLYVERLAARGVMSGYACGGMGEPCHSSLPYFRPNANATRGQLSKIVSNAAGFTGDPPAGQYTFADVPEGSTFHVYVERLLINRPGAISGYACGGLNEPCDNESRPYFRPSSTLTRGQTSKIVANTFFPACSVP